MATIDGGSLRNAIPRESFATILVDGSQADEFKQHIQQLVSVIQTELVRTEPDLKVKLESVETPAKVMAAEAQTQLAECNLCRALWGDSHER